MRRIKLVKPQESDPDVKSVYDDIINTRGGKGWLPPIWGFFGKDPTIVRAMWSMIKRLEWSKTKAPRHLLVSIALVGAQDLGCRRCVNFHQTQLIQRENIPPERVNKILNYEEFYKRGELSEAEYIALKLGDCLALSKEFTNDDWERLTKHYDDEQIFEMIMVALVESILSRYGSVMAGYDESSDWPSEYVLSKEYADVISK